MIIFKTNLDEAKSDVIDLNSCRWPFQTVPRQGERIQFEFTRGAERLFYELEVVRVTYAPRLVIYVELHVPSYFSTIREWMDYMRRHRRGDCV